MLRVIAKEYFLLAKRSNLRASGYVLLDRSCRELTYRAAPTLEFSQMPR
jgi:hypothetical protein